MAGLQYYFFPTDFYYPRPQKTEVDPKKAEVVQNNEQQSKTVTWPEAHDNSKVSKNMLTNEHLMMRLSPRNKHLKMIAGSVYIPKDNEKNPLGEDSHFICAEKQTLGVADGVGGWSKLGVDSGVYARELMTNSLVSVYESRDMVDPSSVLSEAHFLSKAEGSSTACILTLNENIIHAVNVGDSGFMIIRGGKVVYQSPIQQHSFNCPYQLERCKDSSSEAQVLKVEVMPGDIVVAGTDGLFDNMDGGEIEEIIARNIRDGENPEHLACLIANSALYNSFDRYADTPYSRASKKANRSHSGGKVDDITVIVAFVEQIQN